MAENFMMDRDAFEWLGKNQLSYDIWNKKYRHNGETLAEWLQRVSNGDKYIADLILAKKFTFGGRTLANRGTGKKGSYSNCYSIGYVPDSLEGILDVNSKIALTFKSQGGQGLSLSHIRPKGTLINKQFTSDGIVPFMEMFNTTTNSISQGGSRKGALMMSLDIWHKEAEKFIKIKEDLERINKANLSLEIDDEFMIAVCKGVDEDILVTRTYGSQEIQYTVNPVKRFKMLCKSAWQCAEPGVIFTNRFRNYNLMQKVPEYQIETCNPCGEQPLPKHGACNLCSINVSEYIVEPFTDNARLNTEALTKDMYYIVRAMDDVLEENLKNHALKEQTKMAKTYRNIGIGIMGLHDAFIKKGLVYGSKESIDFAYGLMHIIFCLAVRASIKLAKERGNFEGYASSIWDSDIMLANFSTDELIKFKKQAKLRNCSLLSIAPTGSIGTYWNISTGCEPWFMMHHTRTTKSLNGDTDTTYEVWAPIAEQANAHKWHPETLINSQDVDYKARVEMQAALQHSCDTAISSTVNLAESTTPEEIEELYKEAWALGLKGITIYRDGSRVPILASTDKKEDTKEPTIKLDNIEPISRDTFGQVLRGETYKYKTACGTLYITINKDAEGNIVEIFTNSSKSGTCKANLNGETRLASLALRGGIKVDEIVECLKSIQCQSCAFAKARGNKIDGTSCPDIIAKCIKASSSLTSSRPAEEKEKEVTGDICPECGKKLMHTGGCLTCECGWSKCN